MTVNGNRSENSPAQERLLFDLTVDAAQQLWLMKPAALRKPGANPDWFEKVLFAVDTNVVHDYLDPEKLLAASDSRSSRLPIGRIFDFDDMEVVSSLRGRIVDFVVEQLPSHSPLTILPSLAGEMRDHLHRFRDGVFRHVGPALKGGFATLAAELYRQLAQAVGGIDKLAPLIKLEEIEALFTKRQDDEIDHLAVRLHRLVAEGRLTHFSSIKDRDFQRALAPNPDEKSRRDFAVRLQCWRKLMESARTSRSAESRRYRNDIAALAQLELANERLAGRCAVIYLTSDSLMIEAAEARLLNKSNFGWASALDLDDKSPDWLNLTFGDLFVRHPNAFLDEAIGGNAAARLWSGQSGRATEYNTETLADWLTVWVGRLTDNPQTPTWSAIDQPTIGRLERGKFVLPNGGHRRYIETASASLESDSQPAGELQSAWKSYVKMTAEKPVHMVDRLREWSKHPSLKGADPIAEFIELKRSVEEELSRVTRDSFSHLFGLTIQTRVALQLSAPDQQEIEPLAMILHDRPAASHFMRKAASDWTGNRVQLERQELSAIFAEYEEARRLVEEEGKSLDPSTERYSYYLVHAFLLSQDAQWQTAEILADRAILCIKDEEHRLLSETVLRLDQSNGREAYLARAYCRRMLAQRANQLNHCRSDLDRAREIFAAESRGSATCCDEVVPERIDSELLLLQTMALYFEWLDNEANIDPAQNLGTLLSDLSCFVIRTDLNRFAPLPEDRVISERNGERAFLHNALLSAVERCAAVFLALYIQFGPIERFSVDSETRAMIAILEQITDGKTRSDVRELTRIVLALASLLAERPKSREVTKRLLLKPLVEFNSPQFPFDRARLRAMRDRVERVLSVG